MKQNFLDPKLLQSLSGLNYTSKPIAQVHEFYLSGPIEAPEEYIEWFDIIRNASALDTIKIYINSPGGDLYTALQFLRVMAESDAEIICSVEGACMSAATMIFLHGDRHEVTPHSAFMFHDYSSGVFGKGGEQYDQIQFEREWSKNFLKAVYENFLTDAEVNSMLHNKDIWMTSDEVVSRLEKMAKSTDLPPDPEMEQLAESA